MRIRIKESGKHSFLIILPTWLAFWGLSFGLKQGRKYSAKVPKISKIALKQIKKAVKQTKRRYRHYELVYVESDEGDVVRITL